MLDTTADGADIAVPAGWPIPIAASQVRVEDCSIEYTKPFSDERSCIMAKFGVMMCLVFDGSSFDCSSSEITSLREKSELLIIYNTDAEKASRFRSCFRPRYMLISGNCEGIDKKFGNVICTENKSLKTSFRVTPRNTIKLQSKADKRR
ncbi:MAG TPA: hypothetical protein PLE24_10315 [Chitinispirillaceae bacterium]|nr:hypothetical protein [Chitinispirillaceae bacterium]